MFLVSIVLASTAFGQGTISFKKMPTLGIHFFLKDFTTPDLIGHSSFTEVLGNGEWAKIGSMTPGFGLQYMEGFSNYLDFSANLNASSLNYTFFNGSKTGQDKFLLEATAGVNAKLLTDNYFVVPYLSVGLGVSMLGGNYFGAYIPSGGGLQFNIGESNFIHLQCLYNLRVSDNTNYHFQYSIAFSSPLSDKKGTKIAPLPALPIIVEKDTDGDGIVDSEDKCPSMPGIAKYGGCPIPDTDGDGINDENDKCPTVKGLAKYNGCPIPDTDKDGINDEEDKCPTVPGVARYQGCPVPDTDGDGVNDEEDSCPTEKGTIANHGCPEIKAFGFEEKNIQFLLGSSTLSKGAMAELNKAASILAAHPSLNILIEGYTDNTGNEGINRLLSQKRADIVKAFLVKKGIRDSRLTATGYGDLYPIADNKTADGQASNRRVAFKVKQ